MTMEIFDIKIDNLSKSELSFKIEKILKNDRQNFFVTINPEMLVEGEKDLFFKEAIKSANLVIPDGVGVVLAERFLNNQKINRFPGVDLMKEISYLAAINKKSIYFLGGTNGAAINAADFFRKKYPELEIAGAERGTAFTIAKHNARGEILNNKSLIEYDFDEKRNQEMIARINFVKPDILFVAFGHNKQERWISEFLPKIPSVKIAMGVGGSFDFFAGKIKRAPIFLRKLGLEWLWRLILEPRKRIKRIYNAIAVFPILVLFYKIVRKLPYRIGAIGFVQNQNGEFFIAKRKLEIYDKYSGLFDHWQPPQGGVNKGESLGDAVLREVREETGMNTKIVHQCKEPVCYIWSLFHMLQINRVFKGAKKYIFLLKYDGNDSGIKLDKNELVEYKWVNLEELKLIIHPSRKKSLNILLKEYFNSPQI